MSRTSSSSVAEPQSPVTLAKEHMQKEVQRTQRAEDAALWLQAWQDKLAGVHPYSSCLQLSDVSGDGDAKLLVTDTHRKLRVYSGTSKAGEYTLLDTPSALVSYRMGHRDELQRPVVAIACGGHVFIYKAMRAHYKFTLPPIEIAPEESEVWAGLKGDRITAASAVDTLEHARDMGIALSTRSFDLLTLSSAEERAEFVRRHKATPLIQHTLITCMTALNKDREDSGGIACLVLGTENNRVMILSPDATTVVRKCVIPSTPFQLAATGTLDVDYRIVVATRSHYIYTIRNGELLQSVINVEAYPCTITLLDRTILVAVMHYSLLAYHNKGKKQYHISLPCAVTALTNLRLETQRTAKCAIVGLANGEVRVYAGTVLLNRMQMSDVVVNAIFGKYGREEHTLVLVLKSGSIAIKMLPRTATLEPMKGHSHGPPPEQDVPLRIPKKTHLYIELTAREREHGIEMHRVFQRDLCKVRLDTARAYVRSLTDGPSSFGGSHGSSHGSGSGGVSTMMRLTAHVQGLGPLYRIKLVLQNTSNTALTHVALIFQYNPEMYRMPRAVVVLACLVPSLIYHEEVVIECLHGQESTPSSTGATLGWNCTPALGDRNLEDHPTSGPASLSEPVRLVVVNPNAPNGVPLMTALVKMPAMEIISP